MWGRLPKLISGRSIYHLWSMHIIIPSTGKTPFEVIEGRARLSLILKPQEKIFAMDEEVQDIQMAFDKIKDSIHLAQQKYKKAIDKHGKHLDFRYDDWVLLCFTKPRLRHTTGKN